MLDKAHRSWRKVNLALEREWSPVPAPLRVSARASHRSSPLRLGDKHRFKAFTIGSRREPTDVVAARPTLAITASHASTTASPVGGKVGGLSRRIDVARRPGR